LSSAGWPLEAGAGSWASGRAAGQLCGLICMRPLAGAIDQVCATSAPPARLPVIDGRPHASQPGGQQTNQASSRPAEGAKVGRPITGPTERRPNVSASAQLAAGSN